MIRDNIDILVVADTKIDSLFPSSQFMIKGYKTPYRLDISERSSSGILVYVKDNLITKELKVIMTHVTQAVFFELNLKKEKWLIVPIYRPHQQDLIINFLLSIFCYQYQCYENVVVIGDVNTESNDKTLSPLIEDYNQYNFIENPTCFESSKGRCIDLVLKNREHSFMHSKSFETGFSDHDHMIYTILKSTFDKVDPKKNIYRDYKSWSLEKFKQELIWSLHIQRNTHSLKVYS